VTQVAHDIGSPGVAWRQHRASAWQAAVRRAMSPGIGWLIAPAVVYLLVVYVLPIAITLHSPFRGGFGQGMSALWDALTDSGYQRVMLITFEISLEVTVIAVLLGYPTAYFLSRLPPERAGKYLLMVMFPLLTSLLVRTYGWIALLQDNGIVNTALMGSGLTHAPVHLMFNAFGTVVGMGQILLPYAIITMYGVMVGIKPRLMQTAQVLGASRTQAFWRVFFPLSLPGLSAASLLVFIMGLGYFVTPALMGGRSQTMIGVLIQQEVFTLGDWDMAALLSLILIAITIVLLIVYSRFAKLDQLVPRNA
jgi:ABC-type spermidine/putrescine transport system permease subunit I